MIKANELRIGNYFQTTGGIKRLTGIVKGSEIAALYWDSKDNSKHIGNHMASPVPLSPEILEACGFGEGRAEGGDCRIWSNKLTLYEHDESTFSLYEYNDCKSYVEYLHELQNLYFALTGTELPIDEKIFRKIAEKYS